jgi:hypothetical protein
VLLLLELPLSDELDDELPPSDEPELLDAEVEELSDEPEEDDELSEDDELVVELDFVPRLSVL